MIDKSREMGYVGLIWEIRQKKLEEEPPPPL